MDSIGQHRGIQQKMSVTYTYLSELPHWGPVLARWHHNEWGALMPYWSEAEAQAEFAAHTEAHRVPTTILAMQSGDLIGSVSLVEHDFEEWRHLGPWLASLYVIPSARGQGVGRDLVHRAVAEAARLQVKRLYVIASDSEAFYTRLGWRPLERVSLRGHAASLMAVHPSAVSAQAR